MAAAAAVVVVVTAVNGCRTVRATDGIAAGDSVAVGHVEPE